MAAQAPAATLSPPPVPAGMDPSLNNYLQQFSLWCSNNFAATLSNNQGIPGVLLRANDTPPGATAATWQMAADTKGELQVRSIAAGSGAAGPWVTIGSSIGVTDGSDAPAGHIGEYYTAPAGGALTSGLPTNLLATSLPAGDWDIEGVLQFSFSSPVGQSVVFGVSPTSQTLPGVGQLGRAQLNIGGNPIAIAALASGATRFSFATEFSVYLVGEAIFASGTCSTTGALRARRVR
jgi:hypothetical protein